MGTDTAREVGGRSAPAGQKCDSQGRAVFNGIATFPDFLPRLRFDELRRHVAALEANERSYVPTHKKGGTVAYDTIIARAPDLAAFATSPEFGAAISAIVGTSVRPTPMNDQHTVSVLIYDRPGDHIAWHYDHNFYQARHFTVLLAIENTGRGPGGLSHAQLQTRIGEHDAVTTTAPNTLVVFEGAKVLHRVSPIVMGERRVILSMTFCQDTRSSRVQGIARRIKDTAFFGVRALWT
jgi:2OG-Fe(II) oxygenase superfamily